MAASYTQITRQEFEQWLFWECPQATRSKDHAGVYLIPVSQAVGVYLSSSVGNSDKAMGRGYGACHIKLVSLITGRTLNRKGLQQTRYNRTTGWKKNWLEGIAKMVSAYNEHADFYERMAIESQKDYAAERIAWIDANPASPFLLSLKDQLQDGRWLTAKQEEALDKFRNRDPRKSGTKLRECDLEALRDLYAKARAAGDDWTRSFVGNVGIKAKQGDPVSRRQLEVLNEKLSRYEIAHQI